MVYPNLGVERVGVPLTESSYFATFTDSSCCVALSASVLELSANKIQKVTIKFALHFGEVAKGEIQSEFWQNLIVKSVESESSPRNISEVVPRSKIYGLIVQK